MLILCVTCHECFMCSPILMYYVPCHICGICNIIRRVFFVAFEILDIDTHSSHWNNQHFWADLCHEQKIEFYRSQHSWEADKKKPSFSPSHVVSNKFDNNSSQSDAKQKQKPRMKTKCHFCDFWMSSIHSNEFFHLNSFTKKQNSSNRLKNGSNPRQMWLTEFIVYRLRPAVVFIHFINERLCKCHQFYRSCLTDYIREHVDLRQIW